MAWDNPIIPLGYAVGTKGHRRHSPIAKLVVLSSEKKTGANTNNEQDPR